MDMFARQSREQPQHLVDPANDVEEGQHPAPAIGMDDHIARQHGGERRRIPVARGGKERLRDAVDLALLHGETRALLLHMPSGTRRQLAHGGSITIQRDRHIAQRHVEHIMQQECRSFQRREPFQSQHQRQGQIVGQILLMRVGGAHQGSGNHAPT
jgi:hypothetical protein